MDNIKLNRIIELIQSKQKGTDRVIIQERKAYLKKAFQNVDLVKRSTIPCRFVNYGKQKTVIEAKENGRGDRPNDWNSLQEFCDGLFRDHNGKLKVCVGHSALKNAKGDKVFVLNGKPVELDEVKHMLLSKEFAKRPPADWFTLNAENLKEIDGQTV